MRRDRRVAGNPSNTFTEDYSDVFHPTGHWSYTPNPRNQNNATFPVGGFYGATIPGSGGMGMIMSEKTALWSHKHPQAVGLLGIPTISDWGMIAIGASVLMVWRRLPV